MDALLATDLPVIEVHVTNIHRREEFRQHSYVSKAAVGVICGLGVRGYALALTAMADILLEAAHDGRIKSGHDDGGRAAPGHMTRIPFDPDAIRALAAVLTETGLTEIEIAEKDSRIRVVRAAAPAIAMAAAPVAPPRCAAPRRPRRAGRGQPSRRGDQPDGRRRLSLARARRAAVRHRRPERRPPARRCC